MRQNDGIVYNKAVKKMREDVFDFYYLFSVFVNNNVLTVDPAALRPHSATLILSTLFSGGEIGPYPAGVTPTGSTSTRRTLDRVIV